MTRIIDVACIVTALRITEGQCEGDVLMEPGDGVTQPEIDQACAQLDTARACPQGRLADMASRAPVIPDEAAKLAAKSKPGAAPAE